MTTARERLLDFLSTRRSATAREISRAMGSTPANARHHLGILLELGLVEVVGTRRPRGRGRPATLFGRVRADTFLPALVETLLATLLESASAPEGTDPLERVAVRLAGDGPDADGAGLSQRLLRAVQRLNALQYEARWEAHADSPRLILDRCPYPPSLHGHSALERLERLLLERLLQARVGAAPAGEHGRGEAPYRVFAVRE